MRRYERGGRKLKALYPQGRADIGQSRALDEEVAQSLINVKKEYPKATIVGLIQALRERKRNPGAEHLARHLSFHPETGRPDVELAVQLHSGISLKQVSRSLM